MGLIRRTRYSFWPVYCPFISREVTIYDFGFSVLLVQPADTQAEEFRRVGLGGVTEDRGLPTWRDSGSA
jgi:hypothetical protein